MYNIIATGSSGNAVHVGGSLLLDCGVSLKALSHCMSELRLVLLTHIHSDHFRPSTIRSLAQLRPTLRFGCCEWLIAPLLACGVPKVRIDPYTCGKTYDYGAVSVTPVALVHSVPNCGYKLNVGGERILYATDTGTLDGVSADGYDIYFLEANHTEADIQARIASKLERGEFCYEYRAAVDHLSKEKADAFLATHAREGSRYVYLHQHKEERPC